MSFLSDIRHMADTVVGHYGGFPEAGGRHGGGQYGVFSEAGGRHGGRERWLSEGLWQSLAHGQMAATRAYDTSALRRG